MKIQWDVVWSVLRTLLVAGGPVSALLIALGFPPVQVGVWMGIALAAIGVLSVAVPGIIGALKRTDAAKVSDASSVPGITGPIKIDPTVASPAVVAVATDSSKPNVVLDPTKT